MFGQLAASLLSYWAEHRCSQERYLTLLILGLSLADSEDHLDFGYSF